MTRRFPAAELSSMLASSLSYVALLFLLLTRQIPPGPASLATCLTLPAVVLGLGFEDIKKMIPISLAVVVASLFLTLALALHPVIAYNPPYAGSYIEILQAWVLRVSLIALPLNMFGAVIGRITREVISSVFG